MSTRTKSGLSWRTIRRYAKSDLLERADDGQPIYMHHANCPSFCDYACNGEKGVKIAADVEVDAARGSEAGEVEKVK